MTDDHKDAQEFVNSIFNSVFAKTHDNSYAKSTARAQEIADMLREEQHGRTTKPAFKVIDGGKL
jgi:hypothetical protein